MRKFSKVFTNLRMDLRFGEEELKLLQRLLLLLLLSVFRALLARARQSSEAELLLRKLLVAILVLVRVIKSPLRFSLHLSSGIVLKFI